MADRLQITLRNDLTTSSVSQRGLTLIELLVVMAILALAASVVIVNAPPLRNPAKEAATDFTDALRGAVDEAVITGGAYRIEVENADWRIARLADGEWLVVARASEMGRDGVLLSVDVKDVAKSNVDAISGIRQNAEREDRDAPTYIPIDPFGAASAFDVQFQSGRNAWTASRDEGGAIRLENTS